MGGNADVIAAVHADQGASLLRANAVRPQSRVVGGFSFVAGKRRILFAGDTAYGSFFREARERLGAIDLALLPIGAYEPRWFMQAFT